MLMGACSDGESRDLLSYVRERCRIDPDTGCWHWLRAFSRQGRPVLCVRLSRSKTETYNVRRLAYEQAVGPIRRGHVMAEPRCGNADCCCPWHQVPMTRSRAMLLASARGRLSNGPAHSMRTALSARKRATTVLDEQKVAAMRARYAEIGNAAQVAREFGVVKSHAWRIVHGELWRDLSNPFTALSIGLQMQDGRRKWQRSARTPRNGSPASSRAAAPLFLDGNTTHSRRP